MTCTTAAIEAWIVATLSTVAAPRGFESFDMPAAEKSMIGALVARGAKAVVVGMIDVGDCADTILWITGKCGVEKRVGMVSVAGKWLVSSIN